MKKGVAKKYCHWGLRWYWQWAACLAAEFLPMAGRLQEVRTS